MSTHHLESLGDVVLRWASEAGSGPWSSFADATAHVMAGRNAEPTPPWRLATVMSSLGHLDIDWLTNEWSVAPPCLVLSPGLGLCTYLSGWRNTRLLERVEGSTDLLDLFPAMPVRQDPAPNGIFIKCGSVRDAERLAELIEIPIVHDPASALAASLPEVSAQDLALGAPPPAGEEVWRFDPSSLTWRVTEDHTSEGLYRFDLLGRKAFRLLLADWHIVDLPIGQAIVLAKTSNVIRWHEAPTDGLSPRYMSVDASVSLPLIAERAAVAASGLLPERRRGRRLYANVSRSVAHRVAGQLGFGLTIEPTPS